MGTTRVLHYLFNQTQCVGEWKRTLFAVWSARGLEGARNHITDLFLYGAPYSKWYVHEEKINTCVSEYTITNGLCLMVVVFLFLNLRTILLYTLPMMTVFLQTAKNNSHQLQEMQITCKAQTPAIIRSQKAISMTSSGISNFQKIRQNFWHQN